MDCDTLEGLDGYMDSLRRFFRFPCANFAVAMLPLVLLLLAAGPGSCGPREVVDFAGEWRFALGDHGAAARSGEFDDLRWRVVRLPHDWAIAGPFDASLPGSSGKLPWQGVGWYRRSFVLDAGASGSRVYFDFDGVMAFPKVYVNGNLAGEWDYGYMGFRVDATPYVQFGRRNVIAVEVDTRRHGTRWYPGAGIYRKVRMTVVNPLHVAHWGTFVTTPNVTDARATVRVRSTMENHTDAVREVTVELTVAGPDGKQVAAAAKTGRVPAKGSAELDQQVFVANPKRWDMDAPQMYTARTKILSGGTVVDEDTAVFGIRTFRFTADDGFHLNGRRVQLKGVNLHHDHGPLGGAFYRRAMERQLEIMKDMGVNAIRTSHNPPAPELLELCDRMGLFVWDEAFDKWEATAGLLEGPEGIVAHGAKQLANFVRRDRNHPSVFVWSVANELSNSVDEKRTGASFGRLEALRKAVLEFDDTRPVGIGCHIPETALQPISDPLDLTGWNYMRRYALTRQFYPDKPILYTESASTVSTRGYYSFPLAGSKTDYTGDKKYVSSYDLNAAAWSDIPDKEFKLMEDDRFVGGEFVWTGFDYLGEPTPFDREARSSYFGIVDLVGIPKDRFYLYRSYWRPDATTIHLLPHWNWPDRVGKNVPVFVYTNGDSAELFLNGRSLGRRTKGQVPAKPKNLVEGKVLATGNVVDLEKVEAIRFLTVVLDESAANGAYEVQVSSDGSGWKTVASEAARQRRIRFGPAGPVETFHHLDARARYVRVIEVPGGGSSGGSVKVRAIRAYPEWFESDYFDVTYRYRLRWNDVVYEPGELRVVAYKNGAKIGEATMRTAQQSAGIRLSADRKELAASGQDLSYILVEAEDAQGTLCPLAENLVRFEVEGPAEIVGVGNGDQLSLDPLQGSERKLFFGKAMLIVRTVEGKAGDIRVTARSEGLKAGNVALRSQAIGEGR
jgi:hypothetical protein